MNSSSKVRATPARAHKSGQRISWGELLLSLALLLLGLIVLLDGIGQPEAKSASGIGSGFFPIIVGSVLIVVSILLVIEVVRGKRGEPEDEDGDVDTSKLAAWQLLLTAGAVVWFILTLELLGYIVTSAVTFWAVAFAMGSRRHARSAMIALILSTAIYFLFSQVLRISLPGGILGAFL